MKAEANYQKQYKDFLKKLQQARESAGLSQEEAGRILKRNQSFISRCESGARIVTVIDLFQLADLYEINIASLIRS